MAARSFKDLNKHQQLAILVAVPVLVCATLGWFIYGDLGVLGRDPDDHLPSFVHRELPDSLYTQIGETDKEIATQVLICLRREAREKELKALQGEIAQARERLPLESEKAEMRKMIEQLARDISSDIGKVAVLSVRIDEGGAGGRGGAGAGAEYQTVTYQTSISGDLNGIIKYIDLIEKNLRFMTVNSIAIKPGAMGTDPETHKLTHGSHAVQMNIVTYTYNPALQAGGGR
ncbi:MAG: hypothetical protein H0X38_08700 [Planctomycetes bacterium]|nr:hypothetical protein [Planctomycetota bacterium]